LSVVGTVSVNTPPVSSILTVSFLSRASTKDSGGLALFP
jgi:hypothetical protein